MAKKKSHRNADTFSRAFEAVALIFRYGNGQPYPAAGATGSETKKRERDITERK